MNGMGMKRRKLRFGAFAAALTMFIKDTCTYADRSPMIEM